MRVGVKRSATRFWACLSTPSRASGDGAAPAVALDRHVALEHHAAELAVPVASGLDLDGGARVALEVPRLLRLPVGPGVERAAVAHVPERHEVRAPVGPDRRAGEHTLLVEEALELLLGHRDLVAPRGHGSVASRSVHDVAEGAAREIAREVVVEDRRD